MHSSLFRAVCIHMCLCAHTLRYRNFYPFSKVAFVTSCSSQHQKHVNPIWVLSKLKNGPCRMKSIKGPWWVLQVALTWAAMYKWISTPWNDFLTTSIWADLPICNFLPSESHLFMWASPPRSQIVQNVINVEHLMYLFASKYLVPMFILFCRKACW